MFVPILAGGGPCNMSRPMMDLLAEFNALPEGASFATFQLVLYAMGSSHIHPREVWRGPDLNVNGWPGYYDPMTLFAKRGHTAGVMQLLNRGVTARPLSHMHLSGRGGSYCVGPLTGIQERRPKIRSNVNAR
jgi:hypothetical protein